MLPKYNSDITDDDLYYFNKGTNDLEQGNSDWKPVIKRTQRNLNLNSFNNTFNTPSNTPLPLYHYNSHNTKYNNNTTKYNNNTTKSNKLNVLSN